MQRNRINHMVELLTAKGYSIEELLSLGKYLTSEEFQNIVEKPDNEEEQRIDEILREMRAPVDKARYLRMAIKLSVYSRKEITMAEIYTKIADKYGFGSNSHFELRIKQAIEGIWRKADRETIEKYMGKMFVNQNRRPTNRAFVEVCADYILREKL